MGEVKISNMEVNYLKKVVIDRLDKPDLKWTSNPKTYRDIFEDLSKSESSAEHKELKVKDTLHLIPSTFLRNFFYLEKEEKAVRRSNIDKLYRLLFEKNREEYLKDEGYEFGLVNHYKLFSSENGKEIDESEIPKLANNTINLNAININLSELNLSELILKVRDPKSCVHLYISESFLKNNQGISLLIELFSNRFISMIIDYNIKLEFSEDITNTNSEFNLANPIGRYKFFHYWNKTVGTDILDFTFTDFESKFIQDTSRFSALLDSLIQFKVTDDIEDFQNKLRVESFLPILSKLKKINPESINKIYLDTKPEEVKKYNFLCVVGYKSFFEQTEKAEMLKYFNAFSETLREANKIRIFTIPGQRVKGYGWVSKLSEEENILLYQYLYLNIKTEVKTYCLFYDENEIAHDNTIIWHQDYVIKCKNIMRQNVDELANALIEYNSEKITKPFESQELYFAYPETHSHNNQSLRLNDELYLQRILKDFVNRISITQDEYPHAYLYNCDKEDLVALYRKLGLASIKKSIPQIEEETDSYMRSLYEFEL